MQWEEVKSVIDSVQTNRSQLVIVVTPDVSQSSEWASGLAKQQFVAAVNVNLALSKALLDVPKAKRALKAPRLFGELVREAAESVGDNTNGVVLLTDLELLFEPTLQLEPLNLLESESRNQPVIVLWPGKRDGDFLTYATPGHPEFKRYPTKALAVIELEQ